MIKTKSPKKVLFLMQLPPPIHGASAVNKTIQTSKLINTSFFTQYVNITPAKDIEDIGKFSPSKLAATFLIFYRAFTAYIKLKPDLVYMTLSPRGLAFYKDGFLALALKTCGARIVYHMHGKGVSSSANESFFKRKLYQAVFSRASIITLSPLLDNDLAGIADRRMPILHVANGIDYQEFQKEDFRREITFTFLSNFVPSKGLETIIRAAQELHREGYENIEYKFIGGFRNGDYERRIRTIVTDSPDICFNFTGPLFGQEKLKELVNTDVFVYPTENDCFPLVVLEAMSLGLPVITSDQGALSEIVDHGVTGEILKSNSPKELAAVMRKLIKDKEYRVALGVNGKEKFLENYTQEIFEKNMIAVLRDINLRNSIPR